MNREPVSEMPVADQPSTVVDRSASHFLTRDQDGWALWGVDQDSDEPLLRFDRDAAGEERARAAFTMRSRETRRVRWLAVAAIIAGGLWLVAEVGAFMIRNFIAAEEYRNFGFADPADLPFIVQLGFWLQAFDAVAAATFQVVLGLFIVFWLQRRWRREG